MTTTSGKMLTVGVVEGFLFELNSSGLPAAPDTNAYEGLKFQGVKSFDLNIPEPRRISHSDATRVLAVDYLPSTEAVTGEVRVATLDIGLSSKVSAVKEFTVGERKAMVWGSDKQGSEIDAGLYIVQQALDRSTKLRRYRNVVVPRARAIPLFPGMNENASEQRYAVAASPSSSHLWGTALSTSTEGALEATFAEMMSEYVGKIVAYKADGTEDEFLFPTSYPSVNDAKVVVWVDGALKTVTTDYTLLNTKITFVSPPADDAIIVVNYEYDPS